MADEKKKCIVGYRKVWANETTFYGLKPDYDETKPCCVDFENIYNSHRSRPNSDDIYDSGSGIKLVQDGELKLLLNGSREVKFCPFCGAEIEVKQTSEVIRKQVKKLVHDYYEEVPYVPIK
ncbi:MAG: hypothetical protein AAB432_00300 [Patescibacteria group bacterium]